MPAFAQCKHSTVFCLALKIDGLSRSVNGCFRHQRKMRPPLEGNRRVGRMLQWQVSVSMIGGGGDTTLLSLERSPKTTLPGIGLHDPLHGRQAFPQIQLISREGWSNKSPGGAILGPSPPKTGTNLLHPLPPPIVERLKCLQVSA